MQSKSSGASGSRTLFALAILLASGAAAAQPQKQAEALFEEGKRLLQDGQTDAACAKLAESQKLDPSLGTLGVLAACHEQQNKLATALKEFRDAARIAHATGDQRESFAVKRADDLEPKVPRVTVRPAKPNAMLDVRLGADRLAPEQLGIEVPVDPGAIAVVARGSSGREFKKDLQAAPGARLSVDLPDLDAAEAPKPVLAPVAPAPPRRHTDPRLVAGVVAGSVGLIGLGVATAFGITAASENDSSRVVAATCTSAAACDLGKTLRDDAQRSATVSTVAFGVGGAGVATGAILLLLAASSSGPGDERAPAAASAVRVRVAPAVGPGSAGAHLVGTF